MSADPRDLAGFGAAEWIEPDGLGGFAMGTIGGPATRKYHGLLCVAVTPPTSRVMLVNGMTETVRDAGSEAALDAHFYQGGTTFPDGNARIQRFLREPWPTWHFLANGVLVTREIVVVRGRPRTLVRWRGERGVLTVRPLLSGRDIHSNHRENRTLDPRCDVRDGRVEVTPYRGAIPGVRMRHNGAFEAAPDWYRNFYYPLERERGLDDGEDLFTPGAITFDLAAGPALIVFEPTTVAPLPSLEQGLQAERERRTFVLPGAPPAAPASVPATTVLALVRAADQFLVHALPDGAPRSTVIAGFPWFTDWGRDTFICARGLGAAFGPALERELLLAWEPYVSAGMIPNRFPEGTSVEYNAVDASLWYALRCARHLVATADSPLGPPPVDLVAEHATRARLESAVRHIVEGFLAGTRHHIHVDDDGLVHAGDPGFQLTWMDAKIGDWVVTPRAGKPVEIQALWIATLEAAAVAFKSSDAALSSELAERAAWARSSFVARFWCDARGWMYDVIDGPNRDDTLRPNQLYALGLTRPLVDPDRARRALEAVERELLVPFGLRTRARGPGYRGTLVGNQRDRDAAYHEGTVWPFLLGIYADACVRVRGKTPPHLLDGVLDHLLGPGNGQIAECFDGDAPHPPRGCPAQAWSVAEALRVALGDVGTP